MTIREELEKELKELEIEVKALEKIFEERMESSRKLEEEMSDLGTRIDEAQVKMVELLKKMKIFPMLSFKDTIN